MQALASAHELRQTAQAERGVGTTMAHCAQLMACPLAHSDSNTHIQTYTTQTRRKRHTRKNDTHAHNTQYTQYMIHNHLATMHRVQVGTPGLDVICMHLLSLMWMSIVHFRPMSLMSPIRHFCVVPSAAFIIFCQTTLLTIDRIMTALKSFIQMVYRHVFAKSKRAYQFTKKAFF